MADKNVGVFGLYATYEGMQSGVAALEAAGFRATDVAALVPENHGTKDLAHEKHSKSAEGFMTGAIVGGIMGAGLGWLFASHVIGLSTMEPLVDAGILVAMLAGVGALGVAGSVIGGLVGWGDPNYEAVRYEGYRKRGGLLVSVHCDNRDWQKRAKQALRRTGAEGVAAVREAGAGFESDQVLAPAVTGATPEA